MVDNKQSIDQSFKDRDLLITLKSLIFDLVDIEEDMAILDVDNKSASIARVKRVLLQHGKNIVDLKRKVDNIRVELIKERGIKSIH